MRDFEHFQSLRLPPVELKAPADWHRCFDAISRWLRLSGFVIAISLLDTTPSRADALDTWTPRNSGTSNGLLCITYGNNEFVAVGAKGTILTSPDGVTWTPRNSNT